MRFIESMHHLTSGAARDERCRRCDRPESVTGALVVVIVRTLASVGSERVCAACKAEIEAEQATAPANPLGETMRNLTSALACPHCHKQRAVANVNVFRRRVAPKPEPITLERHCACPGGPAEHLLAVAAGGAR